MGFNNRSIEAVRKMKVANNAMHGWFKDTILDPALWITLIASALIAFLGSENVLRSVRVDAGSAMVAMSAALLGIILAGLALFVVFLDKKYIALIEQYFKIETELWPFQWTAIIAILCLAFGMGLILLGQPCALLFRFIICGALWTFSYLLWQIYELVKFLVAHAKARAKQIEIDSKRNQD
jgi:hypothetical protein